MNKNLLLVFISVFSLLAWSSSVNAAVRPHAVTLDIGGGVYYFDGREGLNRAPVTNLGLGYNLGTHWAIEGVAGYVPAAKRSDNNFNYNIWSARLDVVRHFFSDKAFVPYLSLGLGGLVIDPEGNSSHVDKDGFIDWGLGFKSYLNDNVALRVDARQFYTVDNTQFDGPEYQNFSTTASLEFQFGGVAATGTVDNDHDGVVDSLDRCPGTAAGVTVDAYGCPVDSDSDGIYDIDDKCPGTPAGTTVDATGCPADSDHDGVSDNLDKCPDTPQGQAVDATGCPLPKPAMADSDQDGVADYLDKCPGTPQGVPVDEVGCARDSDGDHVFDVDDKCPGTPAGVAVDQDGCPEPSIEKARLTLAIEFASGKSALPPSSAAQLDKAAAFIAAHPTAHIVIEGHTDSVGPAAANQKLSLRRAASVRKALVERYHLPGALITAKGYGESQPVAANNTPEGRQANRRVVVRIAE